MASLSASVAAVALLADPIGSGWWHVRWVLGSNATSSAVRCLNSADWRLILPPTITDGCAPRHRDAQLWSCVRGGALTISGIVSRERFDVAVRRTGTVGANTRAMAVLHVEGERMAAACPHSRDRAAAG